MNRSPEDPEFRPDQKEGYRPEVDGYYPDEIHPAGSFRPHRDEDPQDDFSPFEFPSGQRVAWNLLSGWILSFLGACCAAASVIASVLAIIFSFAGTAGLILNGVAFVLAWLALILGVKGGSRNSSLLLPRGKLGIFALLVGFLALSLSCLLFIFTGCSACLVCQNGG